ncbi:MAG: signal recognition particle-docking protein FtsY [Lactobacillus sp.]|uniref:signal recognition particle-docking protein FtsY n=1 Tax=Limosilactobacillus coleohominis TaxID=181675 RepID=UPI002A91427E|nr:signal recognition particle-docking protein FtsY [Limosilactobacillus coleohominis]MCI5812442.1 signal recognition particle-docking protein FtsY [Lactobacillus sp.]MDY5629139.1 signal recognition particle-docking protein FtsY [Limosilactobacillus coleohominis]
MGLFDIFRRKHKEEKKEEQVSSQQSQSNAASEVEESVEQSDVQSVTSVVTDSEVSSESSSDSTSTSNSESLELAPAESHDEPVTVDNDKDIVASQSTSVSESVLSSESASEDVSEGNTEIEQQEAPTEPVKTDETPEDNEPSTENASHESTEEVSSEDEQEEDKYDAGLAKSRNGFGARLNKFLANFRHVDEDFFEDLEDMMIESDVGYDMAMKLSDSLREELKLQNAKSKQDVSNVIIQKMVELYDEAGENEQAGINFAKSGPTVIMFVGVNGAGKTTTIGKMAALFKKQGKKVLLAAADTFRAGATEQLDVWAKRDGVDIVTGPENGDPAAVVFDGVKKAKEEDYDVLFVDTAGRLQNKVNLMNELAKMKRILTREIPDAPHEVLLVLDATTGQNALNQAKLFKESTDVTGIVLTKLDGTARGGIVLAIRNELHLPVKFVGLGEKVDDLQEFNASEFVYGLFKGLVTTD